MAYINIEGVHVDLNEVAKLKSIADLKSLNLFSSDESYEKVWQKANPAPVEVKDVKVKEVKAESKDLKAENPAK